MLKLLYPPNMIALPVSGSVNNIAPVAGGGGEGICASVQVDDAPSHTQVSCRYWFTSKPPNITSLLVLRSNAIEAPFRTGGATGVSTWVQVAPSKVQVSLRLPVAPKPPKSTSFLLTASYAIAG